MAAALGVSLATIIAISKHAAFAEEREYRLIRFLRGENEMKLVKFRGTPRGLVPYVEFPVPFGQRGTIAEVMIGPCLDFALQERSVGMLFRTVLQGSPAIRQSQVPLAAS
jgi:hypothetical protein